MVDDFGPRAADSLGAITASLVEESDASTVLELVIEACESVLGAASSGVLVLDSGGTIQIGAASDERARVIEVLQGLVDQGPCVDCIRDNGDVSEFDLAGAAARWPLFAPAAVSAGFHGVVAVPMRLHASPVGGLNLLYEQPASRESGTPVAEWQMSVARALADLAVLGLVQDRGEGRASRLVERTLDVVNDRIRISQAVGMVAGVSGLDADSARHAVRGYARQARLPLSQVARALTERSLDPRDVADAHGALPAEPDA